jgi:DinB superfamily
MDQTARDGLVASYATGTGAVEAALADVTEAELDRRPPSGEWTAREIVHHLADSESMAYIRLRRLLAEERPVINGYDEPEWARRLHYDRPIGSSLAVLRAVRAANDALLATLTETDWARTGTHSDSGSYGVERWLEIYAVHPHEHADQIRKARRGEG